MEKRKLRFYINLVRSTTKDQVTAVTEKIQAYLDSLEEVEKKTSMVVFETINSSSLDIRIDCTVLRKGINDFLMVQQKINFAIMDIVEKENASFAYPSQSVYIERMPE